MRVISTHPSDYRMTNALRAALGDIEAPEWAIASGDRADMAKAVLDARYDGLRICHVAAGDTRHDDPWLSHPDHATRDAISMMSEVFFVANEFARKNLAAIGIAKHVYVTGNPSLDEVVAYAKTLAPNRKRSGVFEWFPEDPVTFKPQTGPRLSLEEFLHKLAHCELFRTNSSAGLYEAPILGTPVELVGNRQAGRRGPYHAPKGDACQQIRQVILEVCNG